MKYALVNDKRQEAQSGLSGKCPCCGFPTVAKCGKVKIPHWAHKGKLICDPWWEETEWHRIWKGCFPEDWQEVPHFAENGEKHIADIKTCQGYVIEFQHSPIKSEEIQAREDFYKKMVWIVDGTTRLKDKDRFLKYSDPLNGSAKVRRLRVGFDACALLRDWSSNETPVFFDFGDGILWALLPKATEERYVFSTNRNLLIACLRAAPQDFNFEALLRAWTDAIADGEKSIRKQSKR